MFQISHVNGCDMILRVWSISCLGFSGLFSPHTTDSTFYNIYYNALTMQITSVDI